MSKLKEILERKAEREAKLRLSLESIVSQIKNMGGVKIILFGSLVEGEVDIYSDLDFLVIMPSTKSGKEWMKLIYENVDRKIASDIIVYNRKEFKEKVVTSSFLKNITKSGRVIYEKKL